MKKQFNRFSLFATAGVLSSFLLFFDQAAMAQQEGNTPKKVRLKMYKNINGTVTETDTTMEIASDGKLPELPELKCFNLDRTKLEGLEGKEHKVIVRKIITDGKPMDSEKLEKMMGQRGEGKEDIRVFRVNPESGKMEEGGQRKMSIINKDGLTKFDPERLPLEIRDMEKLENIRKIHIDDLKLRGLGDSVMVFKSIILVKAELTDDEKKMLSKSAKKETSVKKIKDLNLESVNVYPNPTNGKFKISFTAPQKGNTAIKVMDITGKEIYREELGSFKGNYEKEFDLGTQPKGTYFLQVIQGKQVYNKKVMLQ